MARSLNKLTALTVVKLAKQDGRHGDGGGLYLAVEAGTARWVFRYRSPTLRTVAGGQPVGRLRDMGLGTLRDVTLAKAREKAAEARALLAERIDPIEARRRVEAEGRPTEAPTFEHMARDVIASLETGFRNEKHRAQWHSTIATHAASLGPLRVDQITTEHVLRVLQPIWTTKAETASRLRGRIEKVLDAAKAKGHRVGENPARWRGHLDHLLPKRQKLQRGHHAAMAYADVPAFLVALAGRDGIAARALEFTVLSAVRSGEVRGARWSEFDRAGRVWTIPGRRMKAGVEHRVPLTPRMLAILDAMAALSSEPDGLVFPSTKAGAPLSDMSLSAVLRRMGLGVTVHGFRSSFRDWAGSATSFPRELAEEALAHRVGDAVERAYRRGDALERRRDLMAAWEQFCSAPDAGNVVALRRVG